MTTLTTTRRADEGAPSSSRRRYVFAVGACVAAIVAIVVLAVVLSENVVYFRTVSEAVHQRRAEGTSRLRVAGAVVPDTIQDTRDGVRFEITDGKRTIRVVHTGGQPSLFKERAPVVVEGRFGAPLTSVFHSDRILIRHGADYEPPRVDVSKAKSTS